MKYIKMSQSSIQILHDWFPDCGGEVDVDDAIDAMNGHDEKNQELRTLLGALSGLGVETFVPCGDSARDRWLVLYGEAVDSDSTVECIRCGVTVYGGKPNVGIECLDCFRKGQEGRRR